jgi:hypothetical protein
MGHGMRSYQDKDKRKMRIRNHIARDLRSPKYGKRIVEVKRHKLIDEIIERELDQEIKKGMNFEPFEQDD